MLCFGKNKKYQSDEGTHSRREGIVQVGTDVYILYYVIPYSIYRLEYGGQISKSLSQCSMNVMRNSVPVCIHQGLYFDKP